jgi:hypothetical protein
MRKLLLLSSLFTIISFSAFSQKVYLADTAFITDIGFGGAPVCCNAPHMLYNGWDNDRSKYQWVADVFTVPADSTWVFDTVIIYEIKYNTSPSYTFLNCNLQIYSGTPGLGGSVIWGDTSTNLISSTGFTGIYKVDTLTSNGGLMNVKRPIMFLKLYLSPAPRLTAGTYWLSWSAAGPGTNTTFVPQKVLPGRVNPPGQTARGLYGGTWQYLTDSGNAVGMDMIIKGSAAAVASVGVSTMNNNSVDRLSQNIPNPFTGTTTISFYLQQAGYVKMSVYNAIGQLVVCPIDGLADIGEHKVTFHADDLAPGIYYYQLVTQTYVESRQMLLIK